MRMYGLSNLLTAFLFIGAIAALYVAYLPPSTLDLRDTVVMIEAGTGGATGVLIAPDLVLTAKHVVSDDNTYVVKTQDGGLWEVEGIKLVDGYDLAFVKLRKPVPHPYAKVSCELPDVDTDLRVIGNPLATRWGVFQIRVVGDRLGGPLETNGDDALNGVMVIQGPVAPGISGAPVFNDQGEVIGLTNTGFQVESSLTGQGTMVMTHNLCGPNGFEVPNIPGSFPVAKSD